MRQIIHTYKLRLTNLSQGNRSLKLGKLSSRRDIDLKDLGFLEKDSPEEILQKIIAGKDIRLISRLDPRFEPTNIADRRLNRIYRTVNTIFEETGTYDLFIGYPFVEGKFIDGTIARCPVLLFPVRLLRNLQSRPRWKLEIIKDEPISFNKTFFLAYEQYQQIRLPAEFWEEEIEPSSDWMSWVNLLFQKIKSYELELNFNARLFDLELASFNDYLSASMNTFKNGVLTFQPNAILGIFPQSDSALLQDYQQIEQASEKFDLEDLFGNRVEESKDDTETQNLPAYIKEENRFFVTPVDQSQEEALLRIKQGQSLVIHGPPGTGKSQVIVNIIADAMAHGKKVLIVSQKRAALDVVYKRLSALGLGRFSVLVHDYRHDRTSIYRKIKKQIDDIDLFKKEVNDLNITKWEHDYKILSRQLDQLNRQFEELHEGLTQHQELGISVHELYLKCNPEAEIYPIQEIAVKLRLDQLQLLLEKLAVVLDYADIFAEQYPWKQRLSFRHYGYEEKQSIQKLLDELPSQIDSLHTSYTHLSAQLSTRILDIPLNQKRIDAFKQMDFAVNDHSTREDLEAIHREKWTSKEVYDIIGKFEASLEQIEQLNLFKDGDWQFFESFSRHIPTYKKLSKKSLRFFSIPFLQARWFLKRIMEQKGLKLDKFSFPKLEQEFKRLTRLHRLYIRYHEYPFFENFPLLSPQKEKRAWVHQKQEHIKVYEHLQNITYFPKIKPRFALNQFDMGHWQNAIHHISELQTFTQSLQDASRDWNRFLHPEQIQILQEGIKSPKQTNKYLSSLVSCFEKDFQDIKNLDIQLASFSLVEKRALELLEAYIQAQVDESEFLEKVKNSVYFFWIEQQERLHPILAEVSGRAWHRKEKDFRQKLEERRKKVAELILRRIKEQIVGIIQYNRLKNPITFRQIYHQVSKKRRIWSVRKIVRESWKSGLQELVPCWMASPESVAAIFPMQEDFFDVVIFDEASQCFVERAIPVMLRGKQNVIAGDEKQLQPLDLYKVKYEDAESEFIEDEIAIEVESILDLAKTAFPETYLSWHYRSRDESLINFSNYTFYEGKLQVIPPAISDELNQPPISWIQVAGLWDKNQNVPEANRVVELVLELVQRADSPSIGIVTFNFHQQELIKDILDKTLERLSSENTELLSKLQHALYKTENEEFQGLFVKNIENVQGDERDIIIFSIGYAPNIEGKLISRFGLLNQRGGENRLNVAITRARLRNYIVCSFLPHELQVEGSTHAGPKLLKKYLMYANAISHGRQEEAIHLLNQQHEADITFSTSNPIAEYVAQFLSEQGYIVKRNFGDTSYKVDIVVQSSEDEAYYLLGIECEGSHYFSGATAKEREVYRPELMKSKGWKLYRIWARNFWKNKDKELNNILNLLAKEAKTRNTH